MPTSIRRDFGRAAIAAAAAALLAACSGTATTQPGVPAALSAGPTVVRPHSQKSWMNPAAVSKKLLYVSDIGYAQVDVFTYPYLTLAGVLSGFQAPAGLCADRAGNVWVVDGGSNGSGGAIYEYAHGGTTPVNVIPQPNSYPVACAVNAQTGDLAVTTNSGGTVYVYGNAFGYPTAFSDANFCSLMYDGYDKAGNLFVDGFDCANNFHYAELPAGSSTFTDITLNETPSSPGNVQWDGTYLMVSDQFPPVAYRFEFSLKGGKAVGATRFGSLYEVAQLWISRGSIIGPDSDVYVWKYP